MPYSYEFLAIVLLTLHCLQAGSLRPEAGKADEDKCDRQLQALEGSLSQACQNLPHKQNNCTGEAHDAMKFSAIYWWMRHMVSPDLSHFIPVLWAGFHEMDKSGRATRDDLQNYVLKVNGTQLAKTPWGRLTEASEVKGLRDCSWDQAKGFWLLASKVYARAMVDAKSPRIDVVINKNQTSFFETVLYKAELVEVAGELRLTPNWNPHVNIVDLQDDCITVAGLVAEQLQRNSRRMDLRVTCTPCHKNH